MFRYADLTLSWLGHDGFCIEKAPLRIYLDPFRLDDAKPASIVLTSTSTTAAWKTSGRS